MRVRGVHTHRSIAIFAEIHIKDASLKNNLFKGVCRFLISTVVQLSGIPFWIPELSDKTQLSGLYKVYSIGLVRTSRNCIHIEVPWRPGYFGDFFKQIHSFESLKNICFIGLTKSHPKPSFICYHQMFHNYSQEFPQSLPDQLSWLKKWPSNCNGSPFNQPTAPVCQIHAN